MPGIILLGLGPGDPNLLTRQAWAQLLISSELWLRTREHPVVAELPPEIKINSFDDLQTQGENAGRVNDSIVAKIIELGKRPVGVTFAVPGHPLVGDAACLEIARKAHETRLELRVIAGISFLTPIVTAFGLGQYPGLSFCDAIELRKAHVPPFSPEVPVLITQISSQLIAKEVKKVLCSVYPEHHKVNLINAAGTTDELVEEICLCELGQRQPIGLLTCLYLPPLGEGTSFEKLQEIVAHLRAPDGCPWDKKQTHRSLRAHLIEEAYETLDALDSGDSGKIREEFGDLMLQIVLHAQIASEEGEFRMADILQGICEKLVRRHPHVFEGIEVDGVGKVLENWEAIKKAERQANGEEEKGILDGIPLALPALSQAQEYQNRAARVGFDWPKIDGVLEKIEEEIREVRDATNRDELAAELGDLLFALVNFARWKDIDPEAALRGTNTRFKQRFSFIERRARQQKRELSTLSLDEMETHWQEAKTAE
ncbi:MAG: nucleoside triphosphate pyrophosphohydrolase [Anaerolineales bacterium]|nr:nucleoside triphosphate pyrophosphohydrolase [Anaerolineales bacterium]